MLSSVSGLYIGSEAKLYDSAHEIIITDQSILI